MLRAQQERRGAPAAALEAAAASSRPPRCGRHRPAGRPVRRPAVHAAQGDDGDEAGARRCARPRRRPSCRCSGSTAEDHDWPEVQRCTVLDAEHDAAHDHRSPTVAGAGQLPIARLTLDEPDGRRRRSTTSRRRCPTTEFTGELLAALRRGLPSRPRHGRGVRRWLESRARPARPGRLRRVGSRGQAAGAATCSCRS